MADIADKLDEARALIEKGWTRGEFTRNRGCFCAMGAIAQATTGNANPDSEDFPYSQTYERAVEAFKDAIGVRFGFQIAGWNDDQHSKKPVIEAFKKAAALARAEA